MPMGTTADARRSNEEFLMSSSLWICGELPFAYLAMPHIYDDESWMDNDGGASLQDEGTARREPRSGGYDGNRGIHDFS